MNFYYNGKKAPSKGYDVASGCLLLIGLGALVFLFTLIDDIEDLEGWPLLVSREDTNADDPGTCTGESYTWTFYNFATFKGYVTIRFLGESNGYYSEDVYCRKETLT